MLIHKTASAHWSGGIKDTKGTISTESGVLDAQPYGFNTRFEGGKGTNPEELIGAAHAGCFSMALSKVLEEAGQKADSIDTSAKVTLEQKDGGFTITKVALKTAIKVSGGDEAVIRESADKAKAGCPVSKLFNAEITLETDVEV